MSDHEEGMARGDQKQGLLPTADPHRDRWMQDFGQWKQITEPAISSFFFALVQQD